MSSGRSLAPWLLSSISRTVSVGNGRQKQQIESRAHNGGFQHHRSGQRVPHDTWGVKCPLRLNRRARWAHGRCRRTGGRSAHCRHLPRLPRADVETVGCLGLRDVYVCNCQIPPSGWYTSTNTAQAQRISLGHLDLLFNARRRRDGQCGYEHCVRGGVTACTQSASQMAGSVLQALWSPFQSASLSVENPTHDCHRDGRPTRPSYPCATRPPAWRGSTPPQTLARKSTSINLRTFRYLGGAGRGAHRFQHCLQSPWSSRWRSASAYGYRR